MKTGVSCSGVILAGGLSSRFQGRNKAFFKLGGRSVIDPIIDVFQSVFEDILIVTNAPRQYLQYDATLVSDVYDIRSSLTGIHAGLFYAKHPHIFVAACDTPFIRREMVELVLSHIDTDAAAVIPETPSGMEPLFAAYARFTLPVVERHLQAKRFKIQKVFRKQRVVTVSKEKILARDPELNAFFNINTEHDFLRAGGNPSAPDGDG